MIQLTDRYGAAEFEFLHAGWRVGLGRDVRLDRTVVLAVAARSHIDRDVVNDWLMRRAAFSHPYIAQLLDVAYTDEDMVCVFEAGEKAKIGLPNLPAPMLLSAFLQITEGMEALWRSDHRLAFSVGEVLFDGKKPKLLGLVGGPKEPALTEKAVALQLASYFGHALEWMVVSMQDMLRQPLSPIWRAGMDRLLASSEDAWLGFGDLQTVLSAMMSQEDILQSEDTQSFMTEEGFADPTIDMRGLRDRDIDDTEEFDFADESDSARRPIGKLMVWSGIIVGLVVVVLVGGQLFLASQNSSKSAQIPSVPSSPSPTAASLAKGQPKTRTISHAKQSVIPSLQGLTTAKALQQLWALSIKPTQVKVVAQKTTGSSGIVISSTPLAGSLYKKGQSITLDVGVSSSEELVPKLTGLTLSEAQSLLSQQDMHYSYSLQRAGGVAAGTVFAQNPTAYTVQSTNAEVQFKVAASY